MADEPVWEKKPGESGAYQSRTDVLRCARRCVCMRPPKLKTNVEGERGGADARRMRHDETPTRDGRQRGATPPFWT
eukprot:6189277-Pleurochrysis_carterae.AAC.2